MNEVRLTDVHGRKLIPGNVVLMIADMEMATYIITGLTYYGQGNKLRVELVEYLGNRHEEVSFFLEGDTYVSLNTYFYKLAEFPAAM